MRSVDPMAIAVDWLDAYRAARINQIVGMYSPPAVAARSFTVRKASRPTGDIASLKCPLSNWKTCRWMEGQLLFLIEPVARSSRHCWTSEEDGMIYRCRCGPI